MTEVRGWYVARTKSGQELRARENLSRQGFQSFLPRELKQQKRGQRQVLIQRALFPGYIFVSLDLSQNGWGKVNNTFGVTRLIANSAGRPDEVPARAIAALQARTDPEGLVKAPEEIEIGSEMRLVAGPFADWVAEVVATPAPGRVKLLLDLLGRKVTLNTTVENLAPS